ncbi:MAG TPA: TraR/DksA C4-type zinc finger protein [Gaiellales bacterium]|nr:TraR/DksA C4-type zinc finger protein [Gaiellales bacterium]
MSVDTNAARERLQAERERVLAEVQSLRDDLSHSIEDLVDEDGNDSHLADSATETLDRGMEQSLEDNAENLLAHIDAALARLDEGTYGRCERCGQPIAEERLEALPYATRCIECKRLEERG